MSDFDTVLERLLTDPPFAAALAADPALALAGYRLSPDEVALLHSQVTGDAGGQSAVETRANQSSTFGLLSPLAGIAGVAGALGTPAPAQGFGAAGAGQGLGAAGGGQAAGGPVPAAGFGAAPSYREGFGPAAYREGFGPAVPGREGFGAAAATEHFGPAGPGGPAVTGHVAEQVAEVPEGYRIRVDGDGDGRWDRHTLRAGADGSVDILVDSDGDGRADFIGHDTDADGLVDSAGYDRDGDGFFEQRSYDDDGDGWLDRSERRTPPVPPAPGQAALIADGGGGDGVIGDNLRFRGGA